MNNPVIAKNAAANMCERINKLIRNFEKSLAPDEVAAMSLASFSNRPIIIKRLGYWNPDLIVLYGFDPNTGEALKMIQHMSCRRMMRSRKRQTAGSDSLLMRKKHSKPLPGPTDLSVLIIA